MTKMCREIIDMIAEGEDLGPDQERHVGKCITCARTLETRNLIRATTERRNQVPPRPGFSSRAAAGALERSVRVRRKGGIALIGATVAAGALTAAFFMMKPQPMEAKRDVARAPVVAPATATTTDDTPPPSVNTDAVTELIDLADVDGSMALQADWDWLEEPLLPARLLAEQYDGDEE